MQPLSRAELASAPRIGCYGTGTDGARVQPLYVRAADVPDRFDEYAASFEAWIGQVDDIFQTSAEQTGGHSRVRFVTDAECRPVIQRITIPPEADDRNDLMLDAVKDATRGAGDRKYLVFVDAPNGCGFATGRGDDTKSSSNESNFGPTYAVANSGCWQQHTLAHELTHTLGAVQRSAPHSSKGGHCTDEHDLMCYSDPPKYPPLSYVCPTTQEDLLDCGHDDYFHTSPPPGSYLDTHWNVVDNQFLTSGTPAARPSNRLWNSQFEHDADGDRSPDSWTGRHWRQSAHDPRDGSFSARLKAKRVGTYELRQRVHGLEGRHLYRFAAHVRIPRINEAGYAKLFIEWRNAKGKVLGFTRLRNYRNQPKWERGGRSNLSPARTASADFVVKLEDFRGVIYLDRTTFRG